MKDSTNTMPGGHGADGQSARELDIGELVDAQRGVQSASLYSSRDVFDRELETVFGKTWLLLGHESQVPEPGDFITVRMGNDSVILARHRDGSLQAMLNQCRHRGVKLCRGDYGSARSFTCAYHGWCFDTAGKLLTMPHEKRVYGESFDKSQWGLIHVPRLATYRGLVFGSWDETVEPLEDYLAEAKWYLDAFFDRSPAGAEFVGLQKWRLRGNWKWGAEQHVSDFYHAQVSHVSFKIASVPAATINRLVDEGDEERGLQYSSPNKGHGAGWMVMPDDATLGELLNSQVPEVNKWLREEGFRKWGERLGGDSRTKEMTVCHMNIFPNMSLNKGQGYIRLWQPIGPDETEVWSFVFVDKDMPDDIKEAYVRAKANVFSVAGGLEQDDTENAVFAQRGVSGRMASKTKLNMQMGERIDPREEFKGLPGENFDGPGDISTEYSEMALRGFYRRYVELMSGEGAAPAGREG